LARALYGNPFLVVLDEPNANLDGEGEVALLQAIEDVKARGGIVVLIAHRTGMLSVCDKFLVLRDGAQYAFGRPDEIQGRATRQPAAVAAARLKVVGEEVQCPRSNGRRKPPSANCGLSAMRRLRLRLAALAAGPRPAKLPARSSPAATSSSKATSKRSSTR